MSVSDIAQRKIALDPQRSCIVQAPAGSGKTEILTQRYLTLLTQVDKPEAVLAITFTQKAAAEMRERIAHSLQQAQIQSQPTEEPKKSNWQLAQQVLEKNKKYQWQLLENLHRLRIMTIDSLCAELARQLPLLSGMGGMPNIAALPMDLYRAAAEGLLQGLYQQASWSSALIILLRHLDNQWDKAHALIANLLAKRDQWLSHVVPYGKSPQILKTHLEAVLKILAQDRLSAVEQSWEMLQKKYVALKKLPAVMQQAAIYLAQENPTHKFSICVDHAELPEAKLENFAHWQALAHFLTTEKNGCRTWRSPVGLDKRHGFPAASGTKNKEEKVLWASHKEAMKNILEDLSGEENFLSHLTDLMDCPPLHYHADHWHLLEALLELLPMAAAQLQWVFIQTGEVDFAEFTLRALHALEASETVSDLQLKLDQNIQHILVDEFQDTSVTHLKLLEHLMSGWQVGDGRTLFLVGDPMQSIYRFREADVSLFLQAQQKGIGQIPLETVTLSANFRAQPLLLDWINQSFSKIFPAQSHFITGAVHYSASYAGKTQNTHDQPVDFYLCATESMQDEKIVELVKKYRLENPKQSLAILVRARSHIQPVMQALQQAKIPVQAMDIEKLQDKPFIQDLITLTRALSNREDRIAWLAFLRAPWCGLLLADVYEIAQGEENIAQRMIMAVQDNISVSDDAKIRLNHCCQVLSCAGQMEKRLPASSRIEQTWLALGGLACIQPENLSDVRSFFALLMQLDKPGYQLDLEQLENRITELYAAPVVTDEYAVQIMTIHKAKGLEFDRVILPYLEKTQRVDEKALLMWWRYLHPVAGDLLCLAPIHQTVEVEEGIYDFLRNLQSQQLAQEQIRLLYVAATRARCHLDLIACVDIEENEDILNWAEPKTGSFLKLLKPVLVWPDPNVFVITSFSTVIPSKPEIQQKQTTAHLYRFPKNHYQKKWVLDPVLQSRDDENNLNRAVLETDIGGLRATGEVLHKILQGFSQWGLPEIYPLDRKKYQSVWQSLLMQQGVAQTQLEIAFERLYQAVNNMLQDERGRWLLMPHEQAVSEYALTTQQADKTQLFIIDRSFIADGVRWIIDYKLVEASVEAVWPLYLPQLQNYAQLISCWQRARGEDYPIHIALYLPLTGGWKEVSWPPSSKNG